MGSCQEIGMVLSAMPLAEYEVYHIILPVPK
jgi:hypothetical protein